MTEPLSPDTAHALRELVIAAVMQADGQPRSAVEAALASGAISVYISGDSQEYYARWNAWYDSLTPLEEDAYHHDEHGSPCSLCAVRAGLVQQEP